MALLLDRWSADHSSGPVAADLSAAIARIDAEQKHKLPSDRFDIAASRAWLEEYAGLIVRDAASHTSVISSWSYNSPVGPVGARIYTPHRYRSVIVFVHGGGWVIGSLDTHDHICRWLSDATESRVVSVDYGLAPEHPYPTAVTQAASVVAAVVAESETRDCSVFVAGDSAGANIGGMAVLACGADLAQRIAGFISIYGAYSPEMNLSSHKLYGDGRFGLSQAQMQWFWNLYAPHVAPTERSQITPLGVDLGFFPPTLCIGAECDLLLDDTIAFYSSLTQAGIDVSLSLWPGITHGAMHLVGIVGSVTAAADVIKRYVEAQRRELPGANSCTPINIPSLLHSPKAEPLSQTVVTQVDSRDFVRFDTTLVTPVESRFLTSRSRLHGSILHRLGAEIVSGVLGEGALLPNEEDASASFGVSRGAYREAIRTLAAKGLVTATPKIGTRIAQRRNWRRLDPDVINWHFESNCTSTFVRSLFEMRKIIEPSAAALTAMRRNEEALFRLADALARLARGNPQDSAWQDAVLDFHRLTLEASDNELLVAMWPPIQITMRWSLNLKLLPNQTRPVADPVADHAKVFENIASQNTEGALRDMAFLIDAELADTMSLLARPIPGTPVLLAAP